MIWTLLYDLDPVVKLLCLILKFFISPERLNKCLKPFLGIYLLFLPPFFCAFITIAMDSQALIFGTFPLPFIIEIYRKQMRHCILFIIEPRIGVVNDLGKICGIHNLACIILDFPLI